MRNLSFALVVVFVFMSFAAMAADDGNTQPKQDMAINNSASTATDLIPTTNGSGNVKGILCLLAPNLSGQYASPVVKFYVNGGSAQTVMLDKSMVEEHTVAGSSVFGYTGWVPFNVRFTSSIRVTIQKDASGGNTIQCHASWGLD